MRWLSVRNKSADDFSFHEIETREKIITKVGKNYRNPPTLGGKEAKEISRRGERKRSDGKRGELRSIVSRRRRTGRWESAKARFFQVQRIRSVGVLLSRCLSVESQTCVGGKAWGEGRREGKDTHGDLLHAADFHIGSVLSITKIHHSVDTLESIRGMNRLFRSIDRSMDRWWKL